jgi:hypothetical protein
MNLTKNFQWIPGFSGPFPIPVQQVQSILKQNLRSRIFVIHSSLNIAYSRFDPYALI